MKPTLQGEVQEVNVDVNEDPIACWLCRDGRTQSVDAKESI